MTIRVLNTIALVLDAFTTQLKSNVSNLQCVLDEEQTIETTLTKLRALHLIASEVVPAFPVFSFKRSIFKRADPLGERSKQFVLDASTSEAEMYRSIYGQIDMAFSFYAPNIREFEDFEIKYPLDLGIASVRKFSAVIGDLGSFDYYVLWNPIDDKTFKIDTLFYKSAVGTLHISGKFIALLQTYPRIEQINIRIREYYKSIANFAEIDEITIIE